MSPHRLNAELDAGTTLGGTFEIVGEIATGGFARVYEARQLSTGQLAAIKILHAQSDDSRRLGSIDERFRREMRLSAELSHPNIVGLLDAGEAPDGRLWAAFELVPGVTLERLLADQGALPLPEAIHLMTQVLDALSCAHARGVIHRDLKPANIMVTQTGVRRNAMVLDFGLGGLSAEVQGHAYPRITMTQEVMGTPCYAAPEQLRGETAAPSSDLYSWGLTFLECLTGEITVGGASSQEVILRQLGPDPIAIPTWLRAHALGKILAAVTVKHIAKREASSQSILEALDTMHTVDLPQRDGHRATARPTEGERRQLTIVACRVQVTPQGDRRPDVEEIDELIHGVHQTYASLAARFGGQLASTQADSALLAFGYPEAGEDDARRAARAALAIGAEIARQSAAAESVYRLRVTVGCGIHTGLVVARGLGSPLSQRLFALAGPTPNAALRLATLARPGEILTSLETVRLLRGEIAAEQAGTEDLDGTMRAAPLFRLQPHARARAPIDSLTWQRETPLIGRKRELGVLLDCWNAVRDGHPAAMLITADPGMGKSRLLRELRRQVPAGSWLECRCVGEAETSPLRPFVEALSQLVAHEPLEALLVRIGMDPVEAFPLVADLIALPPDARYPRLDESAERRRERTLNTIVALFLKMAESQPLVMALEDAHWADPTTRELAGMLVQELHALQLVDAARPVRLCFVVTARPEFTPSWSLAESILVQPSRLGPPEVIEMVNGMLSEGRAVQSDVLERVVQHADGVPLFVEEVARVLVEAESTADIVPGSLRDLFAARLDRLAIPARETAQRAAALGREFGYELLDAVSPRSGRALRQDLEDLESAGLVHRRRNAATETYVFKHALVRDAAYAAMLRSARESVHHRVAIHLRDHFPEIAREQPELIAHHGEAAGDIGLALEYWKRGGDRAMARGAYTEGIQLFERGVRLLETPRDRRQFARSEIGINESLGTALLATQGYTSPGAETCFTRALAACDVLGDNPSVRTLHGIWGVFFSRGDRAATDRLLPRFHGLAERNPDPVNLLTAHAHTGLKAFFAGDFGRARDEMQIATTWYDTDAYRAFVRDYGYDGGIYAFGYLLWSLSLLGQTRRADEVRDVMVAHVERSGNPHGRAAAFGFGCMMAYERGDTVSALAIAERGIALVTEQKLYAWLGMPTCVRGWAIAAAGRIDEGLAEIERGIQIIDMIGFRITHAYHLAMLADALLRKGDAAAALATTDRGIDHCRTTLDSFSEADLLRLRAAALQRLGDDAAAEACLSSSLDLARRQGARLVEIRTAGAIAHRALAHGDHDRTRALLTPLVESCEQDGGGTTAPVRDARALLARCA